MTGAEVTREYYFNDHGAQIDRFAGSLLAARAGRAGARGRLRRRLHRRDRRARSSPSAPTCSSSADDEAQEVFRAEGVELMFDEIKQSLHDFGVDFDVYFHEDDLHESGAVSGRSSGSPSSATPTSRTARSGCATEQFGDDKDRVIIKSDGEGAYLSGDLAYYLDKRERGFDRCFIMLGADHHGYVGRMMAMCAAFGDTPHENLEILIGQMVNLLRDGAAAADVQAGRHRRHHRRPGRGDRRRRRPLRAGALPAPTPPSTSTSTCGPRPTSDNPVYYVQYAHARTCRDAAQRRRPRHVAPTPTASTRRCSSHEQRGRAAPRAGRASRGWWPAPPSCASRTGWPATSRTPPAPTTGSTTSCRVLPQGDEESTDLHRARLVLVAATRTVLANGLGLLGVSAPERM